MMNSVYINKQDLVEHKATYELFNNLFMKDLISVDDLIEQIENLSSEVEELKEQLRDTEESIQENYKPLSPYEYYGVSEHDFY